ncbi:ER lumen protein retaining receptor, putative [Plasmodium chabaudi chabaudi]|uniref:ER lumen protein-retaining receptor n=2 Tax=Plasmodium chabaudi TaxID=5825 RepID=A0A077TL39_PLACU|nr:ER lumen protein retaining receptor, putative [Plasmodium chabaudi chabaudi]SCM22692.1 ER lumen protein retaining receptor, putative [Plasmodium chabaudi adami]SCM19763.1 ER lumen protein retaining receptor, putative [Plasmodium chabaudi chabaudi]SCN61345.1 ER lumen protein retaining receptor, putative [Plasmodium chabaudi adami]SCN61346.1 ER lumen protein retaining receptor, putative [Plasmodium chabaudi chabaudi]VTZ69292.1 ER lumen protein retaining receptor, putative [Plasmodium chabaudi|eukprot:XP_016654030.1 ER lumen protein retaining receptor, putative [Plasmodium chabaudi chabaudi]
MNIFRLIGDLLHLVSMYILIMKLKKSKNCIGISCRMQELYLIVFLCRYIDLFFVFVSFYNTVMKITFILTIAYTIYLIRFKLPISQTYNRKVDNFKSEKYLIPPCLVLSLLTCKTYNLYNILWSFSIWLESVAILPQLVLLEKQREVENITSHYVITMGMYRAFYIFNWIYRYFFDAKPYINVVGWLGGLIQTLLYIDFFYYFALAKWYGKKLVLPFNGEV